MTTTNKPAVAICSECHTEQPLRPSGKSFQPHKVDGDKCLGVPTDAKVTRPGTRDKEQHEHQEAKCICDRSIGLLKSGRFANHKDLKLNARCPGSNKTPAEAKQVKVKPPAGPAKAKADRKPATPKPVLTPLAKSHAKAMAFATFVKDYGWATQFEEDTQAIHPLTGEHSPAVTAVATRGAKGGPKEEMRITWWGGACIGGDGKITWEFNGRRIAVRNASACKMQAQVPHEFVLQQAAAKAEAAKQKAATKRVKGTAPKFDPSTLDEEALIQALTGRAIVWHNATSGKEETATVKSAKVTDHETRGRTINIVTAEGKSRSLKADRLLRVG